jgi:type II secretion system protein J
MVASTIGAFIVLVAMGTLKAVTSCTEMVDRNISAAAEVRFAATTLQRDLVNFYRDPNKANTRFIGTVETSDQESISYLVFYTVNRIKARIDQPEGDIYEVEYYLLKDEDKSVIMRRLWPNPDEELEPGGILSIIAEDIDIFEIRYFDGEEWSDEWPEDMEVLPQLVEVNIAGKLPAKGQPALQSFIVNLTRSAASAAATLDSTQGAESGQGRGGADTAGGNMEAAR